MEMETSLRQLDNQNPQSFFPSSTSHSSSVSSNSNSSTTTAINNHPPPPPPLTSPKPVTRSESTNPCPTTFVQADTSSFKQVVQLLTGSPRTTAAASDSASASASAAAHAQADPPPKSHAHNIPPIKTIIPKKNQSSSGFKLYERRNSLKNFKINPLNPIFAQPCPGFSPRKPEILSPSILDFPALVLSPVTPLIPDPFGRSGAANYANYHSPMNNDSHNNSRDECLLDIDAEERLIKEKGFYLHPSPATTPREVEPRLLPLFPVTSPRVSVKKKIEANSVPLLQALNGAGN